MKQKNDETSNVFCRYFREYCNSTSIHGIKYLGEKHRSFLENLWWLAAFSACFCFCIVMILKVYQKWETSPIIVTFATKETPIYEIPFPAVTICPETKTNKKTLNYTELFQKKMNEEEMTQKEKNDFDHMFLVCNYYGVNYHDHSRTITADIYPNLKQVAPNVFKWNNNNCEWMGKTYKCTDIFNPIITDGGLCYTFNMLHRDDLFREIVDERQFPKTNVGRSKWTFEHGYEKNSGQNAYPRRALLPGATNALKIHLATLKSDIDYACTSLQGYKVLFHTPARIPRVRQEYLRISLNEAFTATLQPTMIRTSEAVKNYDPKKRYCSLPSERHLYYFKMYSQINCQMECLTNFTLKYCGCVDFYMPHDNKTQICGPGSYRCVKVAERRLLTFGLDNEFNKSRTNSTFRALANCNCLPLCTDVSYNADISQTNWRWDEALRLRNFSSPVKDSVYASSLSIFFKVNHFITSERNELFGPSDFLAHCGGLLGLFIGFSILSLVEIVYFLTLRPLCNIRSKISN